MFFVFVCLLLLYDTTNLACRSEEKAAEAIATITHALEAVAAAIRHNTAPGVKGKVSERKNALNFPHAARDAHLKNQHVVA